MQKKTYITIPIVIYRMIQKDCAKIYRPVEDKIPNKKFSVFDSRLCLKDIRCDCFVTLFPIQSKNFFKFVYLHF